jgi:hypothetical protein
MKKQPVKEDIGIEFKNSSDGCSECNSSQGFEFEAKKEEKEIVGFNDIMELER